MLFSRRIATLLITLVLAMSASAQDLYVSNRPFKGEVVKAGNSLQVEVEPLLQALKLNAKVEGGAVKVGDKSVTVTQSPSGKNMVSLAEFAAAANLTVRKNADFGHTDVYANTTAPAGSWGNDTASTSGPGASAGGSDYTIKVPADYEMLNDPDMMEALMGMVNKKTSSSLPEGAMNFEFVMSPKQGTKRTGVLMLMTINLPGAIPADAEGEFVKALNQGMATKGTILAGPTTTNVGGLRFHKTLIKTDDQVMECYVHLASALGKVYWLALVDDPGTYNTSFGALRNVVDTFRLK